MIKCLGRCICLWRIFLKDLRLRSAPIEEETRVAGTSSQDLRHLNFCPPPGPAPRPRIYRPGAGGRAEIPLERRFRPLTPDSRQRVPSRAPSLTTHDEKQKSSISVEGQAHIQGVSEDRRAAAGRIIKVNVGHSVETTETTMLSPKFIETKDSL